MSRRTLVAPAALLTASALVAACGGASAPALSDPKEILVKSVESIQDATSVHLTTELDGTLPLDLGSMLGGSGGSDSGGGSLDIAGTTLEGDVDIADQAVQMTFAIPAMLNLSGELIVVDDSAYVKASLLGDQYMKFDASDATDVIPGGSPDAGSPAPSGDPLAELRQTLDELETQPIKLADETCGDTNCYHVQLKLDEASAEPLASLAPGVSGSGTLDVYVRQNDLRPSRIVFSGDAGDDGNLDATVTFSDWDAAVDIAAPPADQVTEGEFPGLPTS
jgi:hypothetical protein